ncbi:hypothetical protein B0T17DRAFT_407491 [Bombardia bombarda]|uniref:Uncharacterized protein n=1 Tax=Bombardia bombarda TaxID=252184 RepID=A0AA39U4U7_9PEZI|nr:hypothetical protein B0T17DRAFT_407491 [Bombardia bombarda]
MHTLRTGLNTCRVSITALIWRSRAGFGTLPRSRVGSERFPSRCSFKQANHGDYSMLLCLPYQLLLAMPHPDCPHIMTNLGVIYQHLTSAPMSINIAFVRPLITCFLSSFWNSFLSSIWDVFGSVCNQPLRPRSQYAFRHLLVTKSSSHSNPLVLPSVQIRSAFFSCTHLQLSGVQEGNDTSSRAKLPPQGIRQHPREKGVSAFPWQFTPSRDNSLIRFLLGVGRIMTQPVSCGVLVPLYLPDSHLMLLSTAMISLPGDDDNILLGIPPSADEIPANCHRSSCLTSG